MKRGVFLALLLTTISLAVAQSVSHQRLAGKRILYIERQQYARDHHNTETLFHWGELNTQKFAGGSAMRIYDIDTKQITTLVESAQGVVRDPELSFDGTKIIFSMRKNIEDWYHIYEINTDGTNLKQLTFGDGASDIDPLYLPDGGIIFSSTRDKKYCMCNRHVMASLFRMASDGSNITQLGVSTLFEGHSTLLPDGRILYDRWEYVDRNFGDAQSLWTVNPDGTKHAVYYGNNTPIPGGVIDARAIPGSDKVACIFSSCHDMAWGAMAIIDRKLGVDGAGPVVDIYPKSSRELLTKRGNWDTFRTITTQYEDPFPLNEKEFLVSRTIDTLTSVVKAEDAQSKISALYYLSTDGVEEQILAGEKSLFDPMIIEPREMPNAIPFMRNFEDKTGIFYVQNVYEGTHMTGVEHGAAKYLRIVETPPKRTWTKDKWGGQGAQAPGVNWHSFEVKKVWGVVPVEEDGSAHFEAPAGKFLYFQLLDKDMKMIQSMRSGVSLMPGEVNGCIGCHEDRINIPPTSPQTLALKKSALKLQSRDNGAEPENFSFMERVQPILDKSCVKCHDFDMKNREKLVLARDKNPFFNAAYINLYVSKSVSLIGGGSAAIQRAYSWGSHKSKLTEVLENRHSTHPKVKLRDTDLLTLYEWMDINGVYYPTYETAFGDNMGGRSPLTIVEIRELNALIGINLGQQNSHKRKLPAQISFDRPAQSPCLDPIRNDKAKYNRAVEIITLGQSRLAETPRGDIASQLVICPQQKEQLERYLELLNRK